MMPAFAKPSSCSTATEGLSLDKESPPHNRLPSHSANCAPLVASTSAHTSRNVRRKEGREQRKEGRERKKRKESRKEDEGRKEGREGTKEGNNGRDN